MDEIANILNEQTELLREIVQHLELLTQGKYKVLLPGTTRLPPTTAGMSENGIG